MKFSSQWYSQESLHLKKHIYVKAPMKIISFKQALHFKQLLILITAARTYLGLKLRYFFYCDWASD